MDAYRCLICGETYMGKGKPSNCPFCGAKAVYIVEADRWKDENMDMELSDASKKNLERSLQLEVDNAPFYRDAMARTSDVELQGIFKYLSKVEAEHASVIRKMLKCEVPQPGREESQASDDDKKNLTTAHAREVAASTLYKKFAGDAIEPRVRKVFTALSEIESDHIDIEGRLLARR